MRRHPSLTALVAFFATPAVFAAPQLGASHLDAAQLNTPLIPRDVLFGNPDKTQARLSPDGAHLSFLAPVQGVLNVWVAPADNPDAATPVTSDKHRGIRNYFWSFDNTRLLYLQDIGGDEDWKLFTVDLETKATNNLTPFNDIKGPDGEPMTGPDGKPLRPTAQILKVSPKHPDELLIGLNNRDPRFHDIYSVNIETGTLTLIQQNPGVLHGGMVAGFVADDDFNIRFAQTITPDGGAELLRLDTGGKWISFATIAQEDALTTSPLGFDKTGRILYMVDSRGRNTAALTAINLDTGDIVVLADNARADLSDTIIHPTENTIQAVAFTYDRKAWQLLDDSIRPDMAALRSVADGDIEIVSRTLDDNHWIVAYLLDNGPTQYYIYNRKDRTARFLFTGRKALENAALASMHPQVITSRDGLELMSYLTLPVGSDADADARPEAPLPMVLLVHGGPWGRDTWGYNAWHQWLANRGYAVLSVNFRGSTGLGKNFTNAGDMQWASKMHDDLIDAVRWAIDERIAAPDRIAIMGGSYGGYATLVGLTFTPDVFACGVDIAGPSNIVTLFESIPPYWTSFAEVFRRRVGDVGTEEGRKLLASRSPLTFVDRITKPLLIGQGANDPRVKQAEADQIVHAMQSRHIPVTYVLYPDEGHGFRRPENSMSFNALAEAFLAERLGGRYQPIDDDFKGSTITVPVGAELIPGVAESLASVPSDSTD